MIHQVVSVIEENGKVIRYQNIQRNRNILKEIKVIVRTREKMIGLTIAQTETIVIERRSMKGTIIKIRGAINLTKDLIGLIHPLWIMNSINRVTWINMAT